MDWTVDKNMSSKRRSNMTSSAKSIFLLMAVGLTLAGSIPAETTDTDALSDVITTSDTTRATVARAIADKDTVLLGSVFTEKVAIAMPRGKNLMGRANVIRYCPLLFDKFGGCEVSFHRQEFAEVRDYDDLVREAGLFEISQTVEDRVDTVWSGAYTIYWRLTDSTWSMDRVFLGQL